MARRRKKHLLSMDPEFRVKQLKALEMRQKGIGYVKIAEECGWASVSSAWHAVQDALRATVQEPTQEIRQLEIARLDGYLEKLQPQIERGNTLAITTALRIQERRARYLNLEVPRKVAMTDPSGQHEASTVLELSDEALAQIISSKKV